MVNIEDVPQAEMEALLRPVGVGHLGCVDSRGRPYVVPMHYAFDGSSVYLFTTEGLKTESMNEHPEVCPQVEEIESPQRWQSVMVFGRAERLAHADDIEHAMQFITRTNPTLTPAINRTRDRLLGPRFERRRLSHTTRRDGRTPHSPFVGDERA